MRAVQLYAPGDLRIDDVHMPDAIKSDEVLLKVETAGICGSDLHNFHTGIWISRSPSIPGHEFCATVLEAGNKVTTLKPGDRVVADSRLPCGQCDTCTVGRGYLCEGMGFVGEVNNGGFASFTVQKASQLLKLPSPELPADIAVFAEPLAVALHAVSRVNPSTGESALIVGAGTIGILCAIVLRHRGIEDIQLAEINSQRREYVCEVFGLTQFKESEHSAKGTERIDLCIDASGSPAALDMVVGSVARGGRLSIVGLYRDKVSVDMNAIVEGGLTVSGCAAFNTELPDAIALLAVVSEDIMKIAVRNIDIESVPLWYEKLSKGDSIVQKVIIEL